MFGNCGKQVRECAGRWERERFADCESQALSSGEIFSSERLVRAGRAARIRLRYSQRHKIASTDPLNSRPPAMIRQMFCAIGQRNTENCRCEGRFWSRLNW